MNASNYFYFSKSGDYLQVNEGNQRYSIANTASSLAGLLEDGFIQMNSNPRG